MSQEGIGTAAAGAGLPQGSLSGYGRSGPGPGRRAGGRWHPDPDEHADALRRGIAIAAREGAQLVCLQELTLRPYFAISAEAADVAAAALYAEPVPGGPTTRLAVECATLHGIHVHASLHERARDGGLGYNTAICVDPAGSLVARMRKVHIPVTSGYREDRYFRPGDSGYPVARLDLAGTPARAGFPTCWDQWFPEVARAYSLGGAEIVVYPTAIGSEPAHPGFDTQPIWRQVIVAGGIANGTFVVAVNRTGTETAGNTTVTFYGSSFISDPYGRVLAEAPTVEQAVVVADLDLDQRRDWLDLFPLLATRRPDTYRPLTDIGDGRTGKPCGTPVMPSTAVS